MYTINIAKYNTIYVQKICLHKVYSSKCGCILSRLAFGTEGGYTYNRNKINWANAYWHSTWKTAYSHTQFLCFFIIRINVLYFTYIYTLTHYLYKF